MFAGTCKATRTKEMSLNENIFEHFWSEEEMGRKEMDRKEMGRKEMDREGMGRVSGLSTFDFCYSLDFLDLMKFDIVWIEKNEDHQ